jgi:hypothetical protein
MKNKVFSRLAMSLPLLILAILVVLIPACGKGTAKSGRYSFYETVVDTSKPMAWGEDRDIHVFCDDLVWKLMEEVLRETLEQEMYIVVNEKYFNMIKADIKDIDQLSKYKNLLFYGDLESKGAVSSHLRKTMHARMIERVENSGAEMFVAKNRFVNDQLIVYMVGSNLESLVKLSIQQSDRLFGMFQNRLGERLAYQAYRTKLIPDAFFEEYPFTVKIPENYRLFSNDKANRFLSFLYRMRSESREFPDKYISIYYEDMEEDSLHLEWLKSKRKELADKYYDGDEFDAKMLRAEKVTLGRYEAWRIIGPWKNMKHAIGGGFQSFAFYDRGQKRAYLIDNVVYYPSGDKLPILLELQKLSASFKAK